MAFKADYYNAIRPYMHEDARRVLDQEIPEINKRVDESLDAFVRSYADQVKKEVDGLLAATQAELTTHVANINTTLDRITTSSTAPRLAKLATELQAEVTAFETKYRGWGETLRKSALGSLKAAATAAGFPPGILGDGAPPA
ncbi:MAG TPA: hypothetical protein VMM36_11520 [Opitutaceae bacterium]|nr:hypothetical protein [Opitutaceae bacterium]